MQESGLTTFAAIFMGVSMTCVTILMVWCFWRILSEPGASAGVADAGPGPGEDPGPRGRA
ncbi:MAG TPA: hypothetical protein VKA44_08010 [Gemmatimonadota bacterium]|nr:hypothetical protein [Gemmatimonadota bacterium]